MTPEKYAEWTKLHADLFRLTEAGDARLLSLWAPMLLLFEFDELRAASYAVATDPSDRRRFRENHLAMLREAILAKRAETSARERDRLDALCAQAECVDCYGVGVVHVPHPDFVVDGRLEHAFFIVVACQCPIGITRFNSVNGRLAEAEAKQRMLDLAQFETLHPDWRQIVAAYREAQTSESDAVELARQVDRVAPIRHEDISRGNTDV